MLANKKYIILNYKIYNKTIHIYNFLREVARKNRRFLLFEITFVKFRFNKLTAIQVASIQFAVIQVAVIQVAVI